MRILESFHTNQRQAFTLFEIFFTIEPILNEIKGIFPEQLSSEKQKFWTTDHKFRIGLINDIGTVFTSITGHFDSEDA